MARSRRRFAPYGVALLLVTSVVTTVGVTASPASAQAKPKGPFHTSTPVGTAKPGKKTPPGLTAVNANLSAHRTAPAGGAGSVALSGTAATVGGVGVRLTGHASTLLGGRSVQGSDALLAGATPAPAPTGAVSMTVADPAIAQAAEVPGVVFTLQLAPGSAAGVATASIDDSSFANLYGGDYANRLQLVELPACVLSTPTVPACQTETPLPSTNAGGTVSADVTLPAVPATSAGGDVAVVRAGADVPVTGGSLLDAAAAAGQVMVLAASPSKSSNGETYGATNLSEAYSWSSGNQGGTFDTSYPLPVPASLGGPKPDLALEYDSGSVDRNLSRSVRPEGVKPLR